MNITQAIKDLLAASEPCTLEQICEEIRVQYSVSQQNLLPQVIAAISNLQDKGEICEYLQPPIDDPMEYAWLLSEEVK